MASPFFDLLALQQRGQEQQQQQQYQQALLQLNRQNQMMRMRDFAQKQQLQGLFGKLATPDLFGQQGMTPGQAQADQPSPATAGPTMFPQQPQGFPQVPSYGAGGGMPRMSGGPGLPALQREVLNLEGNRDAVGAAGEIGPGQIMPATGKQYGYEPDQLWGDSGRAASGRIVGDLFQKSGGDPAATLVGYNRGPGAMQRFQASGDNPNAVKLAPAYQRAVEEALSPEQRAQSSQSAVATAGMLPPQMVGRAGPDVFAKLVQRVAGSDAPDEVKGAALMQLLPLMSQEGQRQFQQTWEMFKFSAGQQEKKQEFDIREKEVEETHRATNEYRQDMLDLRKQQALQGKGADWQIVQTPDGKAMRVNRATGETAPVDLPQGAHRLGGEPRSASAMSLRSFMEEFRAKNGRPPNSEEIRNFQAGTAEAVTEGRVTGTRAASLDTASEVLDAMIPLLKEKSHEVDRTNYPTINKLLLAYQEGTGDPTVVQYGEMINEIRYLYARALSPTGQARVADLSHFDEVMNKYWASGQIDSGLEQIQKSIAVERGVIQKRRGEIRGEGAEPSAGVGQPATQGQQQPGGAQQSQGLLQRGNIDLNARPIVHNADGSYSTVRSMSFNEDGKEVLIPTVAADGSRILSEREAIEQYHRTGQFLGKFDTPEHATAYAQQLHQNQAQQYGRAGAGGGPYKVNQIIEKGGKRYRVTGGDLSSDPDVEPVP